MHLPSVLPVLVPFSLPSAVTSLLLIALLSPAAAQTTAADYYVRSLPGAPDGPLLRMHAGHIEVSSATHGGLFFWHFQNRHIGDRQRTVIWLNGGPGCSSMDGAMMEIGPYRVQEGGKLTYNNGSWDQYANLLFVDNPVGTGFSYVDSNSYLHELPEMADQFIKFLENWFKVFPEYQHDDLYIAGESYAGQHIPYIANSILERNTRVTTSQKWRLSGLLIGNGWISSEHQGPSVVPFAYDNGLLTPGTPKAKTMEEMQQRCIDKLRDGAADHVDTSECEAILQTLLRETRDSGAPAESQCINMYDIKLRDSFPSCGMNWPPDLKTVTPWLREKEVVSALNIDTSKKSTGWTECSGQVSQAFQARNSKPSYAFLPSILKQVPIVLFSGADDLICNHKGTEALIDHLSWNGGVGFPKSVPTQDWTFDGESAGTYRTDRNLTYILFHNSSHMVPFDYPKRSRDMLDRFIGLSPSERYPGSHLSGEEVLPPVPPTGRPGAGGAVSSGSTSDNANEIDNEEEARLQKARWDAYYRSGFLALVIVIIAAGAWGWWVWKDRRRRAGYQGVDGGAAEEALNGVLDVASGAVRLESFRQKHSLDLEDGGNGHANGHGRSVRLEDAERYSLGSMSDESNDKEATATTQR